MEKTYSVPFAQRISRLIGRPLFRLIFHILAKVEITGKENIPKEVPYMVAINHVSIFEPPFVLSFWPIELEAIGASDIWKRKGQNILAMLYGGIQVRRGEYDRKVIDMALAALRSGHPLLIAPEGGRSHTLGLRKGHPGVAYLIDKANVPIVPVGIIGSTDDFLEKALKGKRPPIKMAIGKPLTFSQIQGRGEEKRATRQNHTDIIMAHIAALLPHDYHGHYKNHPVLQELIDDSRK